MIKILIFNLLFYLLGFALPVNAHNAINIDGLQKNIQELKSKTTIPVIFPTQIPDNKEKTYASYSSYGINPDLNHFWQINADATPDCHGTRVCNIGFLRAEIEGQFDPKYRAMPGNKEYHKARVILKNNTIAYYTPFHSMASGINPIIEWRRGRILYTLSWRIEAGSNQQKKILINMANSIQ